MNHHRYGETDLSDVWQGLYILFFGPAAVGNVEHRDEWIAIWKSYFFPAASKYWTFSEHPPVSLSLSLSLPLFRDLTLPLCEYQVNGLCAS